MSPTSAKVDRDKHCFANSGTVTLLCPPNDTCLSEVIPNQDGQTANTPKTSISSQWEMFQHRQLTKANA